MKKLLAVGVIVLFLGLAIAPSINANVSKASIDSELVDITTKVCGLNGGKHTVQLTKAEAEEVEQLIDDIERKLYEVETREETVEIFKGAIVELDKYGLLGGLSVKQAQRLIIKQDNWLKRFFNSQYNKSFNLVFGAIKNTWIFGFEINPLTILSYFIIEQADRTFFQTIGAYLWFYSQLKPVRFLNIFIFMNFDDHDIDSIYSLGLLGLKKHIIHPDEVFGFPYFSGIIIKYNYYPPWYYQNLIFFGTSLMLISGP